MLSDAWIVVAVLFEPVSGAPRETLTPDPLITKAFMQIEVIATGIANPVTLECIGLIML